MNLLIPISLLAFILINKNTSKSQNSSILPITVALYKSYGVIHLLIKYLPYNDQYKFLQYLKSLNDDLIIVYNDKSLEKYIKILENKLNS